MMDMSFLKYLPKEPKEPEKKAKDNSIYNFFGEGAEHGLDEQALVIDSNKNLNKILDHDERWR